MSLCSEASLKEWAGAVEGSQPPTGTGTVWSTGEQHHDRFVGRSPQSLTMSSLPCLLTWRKGQPTTRPQGACCALGTPRDPRVGPSRRRPASVHCLVLRCSHSLLLSETNQKAQCAPPCTVSFHSAPLAFFAPRRFHLSSPSTSQGPVIQKIVLGRTFFPAFPLLSSSDLRIKTSTLVAKVKS